MLSNLVTSLFRYEKIKTTAVRAGAAKSLAERLINYAKEGSLSSRRLAGRTIRNPKILKKLFDDIAPRMKDRNSGFVIVTKLWPRHGDSALMAMMELKGAKVRVRASQKSKEEKKSKTAEKPKPKKEGKEKTGEEK